jgi:hypothetical protein
MVGFFVTFFFPIIFLLFAFATGQPFVIIVSSICFIALVLAFYGPTVIFTRAEHVLNKPENRILVLLLIIAAAVLIANLGFLYGIWIFSFILTFVLFQKPGRVSGWIACVLRALGLYQERDKK